MGTANGEIVSVEVIVPLYVRIGYLKIGAWFGIIENLAVDKLLGTSFIDRCNAAYYQLNKNSSLEVRDRWGLFRRKSQSILFMLILQNSMKILNHPVTL